MSQSDATKDFKPPSKAELRHALSPARLWFDPYFRGLDALDLRKPALFVGNHTIYGVTDVPLMIEHLYRHHDIFLRSLGDKMHLGIPGWGQLLTRHGMVPGTPENCTALMQSGAHILVFPGGAREVMKRKSESYQLVWKQRSGFARMAIEHGYDIIPFGVVGPDESYKILLDADDITDSSLWQRFVAGNKLVDRLTRQGDLIPPIARGIGLTTIPRPQRYYFGFGQRIETAHLNGDSTNAKQVNILREQVKTAIEAEIDDLLAYRREDLGHWGRLRKWLAPTSQ